MQYNRWEKRITALTDLVKKFEPNIAEYKSPNYVGAGFKPALPNKKGLIMQYNRWEKRITALTDLVKKFEPNIAEYKSPNYVGAGFKPALPNKKRTDHAIQ